MLSVKTSTLCEWNHVFDKGMNPLVLPDKRGKAARITVEVVREVVEAAEEFKASGKRLRIKSFTGRLAEQGVELSSKKVTEILIANDLYKVRVKKRQPLFYQSLRQTIPNGLVSADGKEFTVLVDKVAYKLNLELAVDVKSFYHSGHSISDTETTKELIKVLEAHRASWGHPLAMIVDHGRANLSGDARAYLSRHDIEILPAGPRNPKGNGTVESAFSGMEEVIGTVELSTASPRELAKGVLQKIVEVYIIMRNRLARLGTTQSPEAAMRSPARAGEREECKARYKERAQKKVVPNVTVKWDRLDWLVEHHRLEVDEPSLKRARKCIASYDLEAIAKSEEAFLKAIRKDQRRSNLAYFFGILRNIQEERDSAGYQAYCQQRYNFQQMVDRAKSDKKENAETTVDVMVQTLCTGISSPMAYIKEVAIRQAKRMALNLKQQYRYLGALRRKVQDVLGGIRDLTLTQRHTIMDLVDQFLT